MKEPLYSMGLAGKKLEKGKSLRNFGSRLEKRIVEGGKRSTEQNKKKAKLIQEKEGVRNDALKCSRSS